MKIILSYVNTAKETINLDMEVEGDRFLEYVRWRYPDWTSYQIIVTRDNEEEPRS